MTGMYFDQRWCIQHGIGRFATEVRKRLSGWNDVPINGYPTNPLDAVTLARCLHRERANLFFSPGFNVPAWSRCPTVCTVHDLIHVHYPKQRSRLTLAYYRCLQRPIVRRSPLTLTVSEFSRRQIIDWYDVDAAKVVCVGNGVSDDFTVTGESIHNERPYFLYVGNTRPHKNVNVLLKAMALLPADVTLTMVLNPDTALLHTIHEQNLNDRIKFITGLPDFELAKYYRGATATILPSHYEGFGLPMVEAMACGCPVIAADRTSIPEVVGNAGVLFDANDSEELATRMTQALDHRNQVFIGRGIERAKLFRWNDVMRRVNTALSAIAGASG